MGPLLRDTTGTTDIRDTTDRTDKTDTRDITGMRNRTDLRDIRDNDRNNNNFGVINRLIRVERERPRNTGLISCCARALRLLA